VNKIIQQDLQTIVSAPLPWKEFEGSTVLVTGGAGFLPAYMVETLLYLNRHVFSRQALVVLFVRNERKALERFAGYTTLDGLLILERNMSLPIQDYRPYDYIIHAASPASPISYLADPIGTIEPNTLGTNNLLRRADSSHSKGFLFFSSGDADLPIDPLDLRACYGESKRMGETMCAAWHRQFGVPAKIVRISHTYGPGMRLDDGRVFADFTRDILNGGPIVLNSDGSAHRAFLYLAEATVAFFTVLLKGECAKAYNVANPYSYTSIADLANRLGVWFNIPVERRGEKIDTPIPQAVEGTGPYDITLLKELGWNPSVMIEQGFARTVESYR